MYHEEPRGPVHRTIPIGLDHRILHHPNAQKPRHSMGLEILKGPLARLLGNLQWMIHNRSEPRIPIQRPHQSGQGPRSLVLLLRFPRTSSSLEAPENQASRKTTSRGHNNREANTTPHRPHRPLQGPTTRIPTIRTLHPIGSKPTPILRATPQTYPPRSQPQCPRKCRLRHSPDQCMPPTPRHIRERRQKHRPFQRKRPRRRCSSPSCHSTQSRQRTSRRSRRPLGIQSRPSRSNCRLLLEPPRSQVHTLRLQGHTHRPHQN